MVRPVNEQKRRLTKPKQKKKFQNKYPRVADGLPQRTVQVELGCHIVANAFLFLVNRIHFLIMEIRHQ